MLMQFMFGLGDTAGAVPTELEGFVLLFVKVLFIIGILIYAAFSVIVVRQVQLMRQTLVTNFSTVLQLIAYIHLALTLGVLVLYFFIL